MIGIKVSNACIIVTSHYDPRQVEISRNSGFSPKSGHAGATLVALGSSSFVMAALASKPMENKLTGHVNRSIVDSMEV